MLPKIVLIHGNYGSTAESSWLPWVKRELEAAGLEVIAETMPDNELARASYWLPHLKDVLQADENTILVGHSSGAVAAMRYAESHPIYASVLVGACYTDLDDEAEKLSGYYDDPWQWEAIKAHQNWIVQYASTDDPWIPIAEAHYIHEQLATDYYEFNDQGHFGGDKEKLEFPELVNAIKQKLAIKG
ncbi:MAG: hypothetical protein JWM81_535 [Candidatus Saccharibacteria bacterium]|nr:hypothetical protein [Candidatus Saccharibacteria bacterium]